MAQQRQTGSTVRVISTGPKPQVCGGCALDFRADVSRALVGVAERAITVPMIAPCGEQSWYTHQLEAIMQNGVLTGYRATIAPHAIETGRRRWFNWRAAAPRTVWNFEAEAAAEGELALDPGGARRHHVPQRHREG